MASSTIRIHDNTKKILQDYIEEFKAAHNVTLTMDQVINNLLYKPPATSTPPAPSTSKKNTSQVTTKLQDEIIKLHHEGMKTPKIATTLQADPSYCRKVVREEKKKTKV